VGSDSRGRDLPIAGRAVAWSGVDLTGIVSPRDSCEAREAQQVLWLGEGVHNALLGLLQSGFISQQIALSSDLTSLAIFPHSAS
jgi:hypothetical protein